MFVFVLVFFSCCLFFVSGLLSSAILLALRSLSALFPFARARLSCSFFSEKIELSHHTPLLLFWAFFVFARGVVAQWIAQGFCASPGRGFELILVFLASLPLHLNSVRVLVLIASLFSSYLWRSSHPCSLRISVLVASLFSSHLCSFRISVLFESLASLRISEERSSPRNA